MVQGRATVTLAYPIFERHGLAPALALLDDAGRLVEGAAGAPVRLLASIQKAGFLGRGGDWAGAVDALVAAERDREALTPREECSLLLNRGLARTYLHDLPASDADLRRSLALAVVHGFADLEFKARHNVGCLEFVRGDLPAALRLMGEADEMAVDVARATAKLDYARVLLEAGLLDRADDLLREALDIASGRRLRQEEGEILLDQARLAVILGDYRTARSRAMAAARMFRSRQAAGWRHQAETLRVQSELSMDRLPTSATRTAAALARAASASPVLRHQSALLAAEAALQAGDPQAAADWLGTGRPPRALTFSTRLQDSLVRARIELEHGNRSGARRRLRAASVRMSREQARLGSLDTRTALALHGRRLCALDLDLALASGSPTEVFAATERWRAQSQRLPAVVPSDDPELAGLTVRLRQARNELREAAEGGPAAKLRGEVSRLEHAIARHGWAQSQADPGSRGLVGTTRLVSLKALARAAEGAGTDAVSFFTHGGRLRAVTLGDRASRVVDLGPVEAATRLVQRIIADLAAGRHELPGDLGTLVERSLQQGLSDLGSVVAPAISADRDRLLVMPSRLLASVPWRMLPDLAGRPVVVSPSATVWARGSLSVHAPGVSAPGTADPRAVTALAGPGLRRSTAEAQAVAAAWSDSVALTASEATGLALTDALRGSRVVHVGAHGTHHEQSPLFSSVQLADGPVFAYEFPSSQVRAEHVVLSACDVGRAVVRPGEEALGLTASLLACGVTSVVASVGPVADDAAELAMTAYHRQLAQGVDAAAALERATATIPQARRFCTFGADWALSPDRAPGQIQRAGSLNMAS